MQILTGFRKICTLFIFTLCAVAGYSQSTINSYKYVLLSHKFEFLAEPDEFGLNTSTKSLLEQKGFTVIWSDGDLPQTLSANKCNALVADVKERKAFLTTNLTLLLKDCFGNIIYKGKEGKSREKEYGPAYKEALTDAFVSLNAVPYKYDSILSAQPPQPATVAADHQTLVAQVIPNGYQLVDTTSKRVMTLLKTSVQDCFLAESGTGSLGGIVFRNNGEWFFEYYKDGALVSQKLAIKF